jgi:hypothetical protein
MNIAPLLIKIHECETLTEKEQVQLNTTLAKHNIDWAEALALNLWSSNAPAIQEYILKGHTYHYASHVFETLANELWYLTPDGEEVRYVLEALQNICYAGVQLPELYEQGRKIALPGMETPVLSAMRKMQIAANAQELAGLVYKAVHRNTLSAEKVVYRAIKSEVIGPSMLNRGFVSTSATKEASFAKYPGYNTLFELTLPEGLPCIDITPFSNYDTVESEILLPPCVFTFTEKHTEGDLTVIKANVEEVVQIP